MVLGSPMTEGHFREARQVRNCWVLRSEAHNEKFLPIGLPLASFSMKHVNVLVA